jgi:glycerol kinase
MIKKYILSLDQGTTSSRALLFDQKGTLIGIEQKEFKQYYPHAGWVEQDPEDIFSSQLDVVVQLLKKLNIQPGEIAGLGITNQRETTIVWDRKTGKPLYNAIVWQDKRTIEYCYKLKASTLNNYITNTTGLIVDCYFSGSKIHWLLENVPGLRKEALNGDVLFGTVDTWLIWKLTQGKLHITDHSNASRTLLYNIHENKWDNKLLELFDVPLSILPEIVDSSAEYGIATIPELNKFQIPIAGIAGDQQAALFGHTCFDPGMAKNTYGTGCFMLMNIGEEIKISNSGLLTTVAWKIGDDVTYAFEGSVFNSGSAINWLRDNLNIINSPSETEKIASSLEDNEGVYFVPAFSGLGTPHWNMDARGSIFGMTQKSDKRHLIRATLESIAYQSYDVLNAMEKDSGISIEQLHVDGGAIKNNFLMQFQSDILNKNVIIPKMAESTALGAAFLAGLAVNFWSLDEIKNIMGDEKVFNPNMDQMKRDLLLRGWLNAIQAVNYWTES